MTLPRQRIGCQITVGGQSTNLANREVWLIQPWANDAQVQFEGMCRSWVHVKERHIDKYLRPWFGKKKWVLDFEAVYGREEKTGHVLGYEERLEAIEAGCPWLIEGFGPMATQCWLQGIEVVAHTGRPNSTGWADELISDGDGVGVFDEFHSHDLPLFRSGVRIGRDNMSDAKANSLDYHYYMMLNRLGCNQQIEAIPRISQTYWYGETCRLSWELYNKRHVLQLEPGFHKAGTKEFIKCWPDVRVSINAWDFGANPADSDRSAPVEKRKAWLAQMQVGVKGMLAQSANVVALLNNRIIEVAVESGVAVESFLP